MWVRARRSGGNVSTGRQRARGYKAAASECSSKSWVAGAVGGVQGQHAEVWGRCPSPAGVYRHRRRSAQVTSAKRTNTNINKRGRGVEMDC